MAVSRGLSANWAGVTEQQPAGRAQKGGGRSGLGQKKTKVRIRRCQNGAKRANINVDQIETTQSRAKKQKQTNRRIERMVLPKEGVAHAVVQPSERWRVSLRRLEAWLTGSLIKGRKRLARGKQRDRTKAARKAGGRRRAIIHAALAARGRGGEHKNERNPLS
jgi:hypothetical protein